MASRTDLLDFKAPSQVVTLTYPLNEEQVNKRVGQVYVYTAGALAVTALSAVTFAKAGFAATLMANPLASSMGLLAVAITLVTATMWTPKENSSLKQGCYGLFAVTEGLILSPLVVVNAGAFAVATTATVLLTGGLGALAMNLKANLERYETILMVGLGAIACASLGALFLPGAAGFAAHQISLMGGFALFSAFVIYDTQVTKEEAKLPEFDPINRSVHIYLDAVSLLIRFWEIFRK